ncbi:hypothetical protein DL89DRAFT_113438 [Linderina pennispora]|uniref:Carbohydrate-binding module family 19 domain-containing protein n=1 Tax=Linderina pennispora TaxID=61395 RepID=A0A1Y1WGK0_9FUNG|nr:uncharacterized protein DL89DRAFT_113438 [Linderina pennispora]ORX72468.1 hypothetical protein DL89DRAFT_113438 [Linderina pennispora]
MKYAITITALLSLAYTGTSACVSGTYRCAQKSGLAAQFLQCANGSEISMMCGPGTVCYSQGNSIMCGFPVDTASEPATDKGLVAGAQCQALSPWDEYVCPGESGVPCVFPQVRQWQLHTF